MRILRGVGSRMLPCGCLVGLYEAYDTKTVALIDARGSGCLETAHRVDAAVTIDVVEGDATISPTYQTDRSF